MNLKSKLKTIGLLSIITIAIMSTSLLILTHLPEDIYRLTAVEDIGINVVGIVSAGEYPIEVFEQDQITLLTHLDWETVTVNKWKHRYMTVHCPTASSELVRIVWTATNPDYIAMEFRYGTQPSQLTLWPENRSIRIPTTEWIYVDIILTALPEAYPNTSFNFDITLVTQ